jgi:16S rRNA (adenine1518-N6/adenine1519-N6)-dimethyltransferase
MVLAEKDRTLAARLTELHAGNANVQVICGDFLQLDPKQPPLLKVSAAIGNLPFYVTSEILLQIIVDMPQVTQALFGIQLEVAERLSAGKGSSLAIALAAQGKVTTVGKISRSSFFPAPNVDAAINFFERANAPARPNLRLLLVAAFWGKRKALRTSLRNNPFWKESAVGEAWSRKLMNSAPAPAGIESLFSRRADDLDAAEFCALYDWISAMP